MSLVLDDLPEELIVEICGHLDIFDLVAFSVINKKIRTIATTLRSFWIPAIAQSNLFVPLPNHRPLVSYTATELSVAAYRAVKTELNLLSPQPELQSWFHIKWPYGLSPDVYDYGDWEQPASAIYMHLSHPNAEWMFMVSNNNIIRILHLRSGNLALINSSLEFRNPQPDMRNVSWAAEFRGDLEARFVIGCYLQDEDEPENGTARMALVGTYTMQSLPLHIDIAGDYIVAIESASFPFLDMDTGSVHLVKWREAKKVETPPFGEAIRIAAFQDYFVVLSIVSKKLVLHVIGLPTDLPRDEILNERSSGPKSGPVMGSADNSTELTNEIKSMSTIGTTTEELRVFSYRVPFYPKEPLEGFSAQICHIYTGERQDVIRLWIRHSQHGTWSVFSVNVDFGALRYRDADLGDGMETVESTHGVTATSGDGGGNGRSRQVRKQLIPKSDISEDTRVMEETDLQHYAVPITPGRRLLWWRDLRRQRPPEPAEPAEAPDVPPTVDTAEAATNADDSSAAAANEPSTSDVPADLQDASGSSVPLVDDPDPNPDLEQSTPQPDSQLSPLVQEFLHKHNQYHQQPQEEFPPTPRKTMALCIAKTDELATFAELETARIQMDSTMNPMQAYEEGTPQRRQQDAVRMLQIPAELECLPDLNPYMFVMEEYSGTILVQMATGDLWVLRYGKP